MLMAVLLLSPILVTSQSVQFNSISVADGLSQATVNCLEQDQRGFIWVGTEDGLNRYDGYSFAVLRHETNDSTTLSSNNITSVEAGSDETLWVGTTFGLNKLNTRTMHSKSYHRWFADSTSLSSNKIRCLKTDSRGQLWIGTDNGLNVLDTTGSKFRNYSIRENDNTSLSNNSINDILIDSKNRVWIATDGGLNLYNKQDDSFIRFRQKFEDTNSLSDNNVLCLAEGNNGNIWIGTRNGLNKYNPEVDVFSRYYRDRPRKNLLSSNIINALVFDEEGDLWIGTPSGLNKLYSDREITSLYRMGEGYELPNDYILELFEDASGMVWIGTQSAGIATMNDEIPRFNSITYTGKEGYVPERNKVLTFCPRDSTHILVGTAMGLAEFNLETEQSVFLATVDSSLIGQLDQAIYDVAYTSDSTLWIATNGAGLVARYPDSLKLKYYQTRADNRNGISSNRINEILPDGNGNLWLATSGGGLCYFNRAKNSFKTYRYDGNNPNSIRDNNIRTLAMTGDNGIWIGTGNAGIYYLNFKTQNFKQFQANQASEDSLKSNRINQLYIDRKNKLWVATNGGGLSWFNVLDSTFVTYRKGSGLINDVVHSITSDMDGIMWISTNLGLSAYNSETNTFRNYTGSDVLGKNTFRERSCYYHPDGHIFFGGDNGFDYFNSQGLKENFFVPPVVITGFQRLDKSEQESPLELAKNLEDNMELDYNHSGFALDFAALNFKQSYKNQYAYRVKGIFDKWRYIGTRRNATFSSLNPGKYTFEVIGSNNDGLWTDVPATFKITVRPAFWQTIWFQLFSVLAVLGLLYIFYRFRITSEKARTNQLEEAVQLRTTEISKERDTNAILLKEVHHRVKNNLQIIVSLLNLQSRFITDTKLIDTFNEIQNRVRSMSLIHQKMYQTEDLKSVNIEEYITDLSQSLLRTYRIDHKVDLDIQVEVNNFNSDTLTPLGLIINEIISNALKYAFEEDKKGKIFVRLGRIGENRFQLIIGDDGVGIPSDESTLDGTDSFGTELISALTEQLNGSIEHLTEKKGTVYRIEFEDVVE